MCLEAKNILTLRKSIDLFALMFHRFLQHYTVVSSAKKNAIIKNLTTKLLQTIPISYQSWKI